MSVNGVLKEEPVICSPLISIQGVIRAQHVEPVAEDEKPKKGFGFLPALLLGALIIVMIWYICFGWEVWR